MPPLNMRRTSLFNRHFALSRKAALSLPLGRGAVRRDSEGFDDIDEYFEGMLDDSQNRRPTQAKALRQDGEEDRQQHVENAKVKRTMPLDLPEEVKLEGETRKDQDYPSIRNQEPLQRAMDVDYGMDDHDDYGDDQTTERSSEQKDAHQKLISTESPPKSKPNKRTPLARQARTGKSKKNTAKITSPAITPTTITTSRVHDPNGLRKSTRRKIPPLEFWRNEKVVYGRRLSSAIPVIVDVVRKEAQPEEALPRRAGHAGRKAVRKAQTEGGLRRAGFRPRVSVAAQVMDFDAHQEVERLLALGPDQLEPSALPGETFQIQTIFTEGNFLSSGVLLFPPKSHKPARNSSKHVLIFFVAEGAFEVTIHGTSFVVGTGCQFIVPRGNQYSIRSVWDQEGRLFFCHCKDTSAEN